MLEKTKRVVRVDVPPGALWSDIALAVQRAVSGMASFGWSPSFSADRVALWHRRLFRAPITVVLEVGEVKKGGTYADVDNAARKLAATYRMVIDSSDKSLPPEALATKREFVLTVDLMARDVLQDVPEFRGLLDSLEKEGLLDLVWTDLPRRRADGLRPPSEGHSERKGRRLRHDNRLFSRGPHEGREGARRRAGGRRARHGRLQALRPVQGARPRRDARAVRRRQGDGADAACTGQREVSLPSMFLVLAPATPAMALVLKHDLSIATLPHSAVALKALLLSPPTVGEPAALTSNAASPTA